MKKKPKAKGRPTKYKPEYAPRAYKMCLLGATDEELATHFRIAQSSLNLWKKHHPEFKKALLDGKDLADSEVAAGLYKRAIGFEYDEKTYEDKQLKKVVRKTIPPDPGAAMNWLKNRQSKKWKERVEHDVTIKEEQVFNLGEGRIIKF